MNKSSNPFDLTKASDYNADQIHALSVDRLGAIGIFDLIRPTELRPILVLGSKGSGKTHLMRYCSSAVQRLRHDGMTRAAALAEGFLGVYVVADGLNGKRFKDKGYPEDRWQDVFRYYFELWVTTYLLGELELILKEVDSAELDRILTDSINDAFNSPLSPLPSSISDLRNAIRAEIKRVDHAVLNCQRTKSLDVDIKLTSGSLIFGIPELLREHRSRIGEFVVTYLIDELENFSESQQVFINSLIRFRKGPCTIRVGSRLYGVRTKKTDAGSEEQIKEGSEYDVLHLDHEIRNLDQSDFLRRMAIVRLQRAGLLNSLADPGKLAETLDSYFDEPDYSDNYRHAALDLVPAATPLDERPHFKKFKGKLESIYKAQHLELEDRVRDEICQLLSHIENPLLEKANIYYFYTLVAKGSPPDKAAKQVNGELLRFSQEGEKNRYAQALDHFKSDLFAQLARDCNKDVVYAGVSTLEHMASGIPRNFLGLLQHIYRRAIFNGERPFIDLKISLQTQQEAVRDAADWYANDSQPDSHGHAVRRSVELLAEFLKEIRYADKPVECSCISFSAEESALSEKARETLEHAENWSFLIRIRNGYKHKNREAVEQKWQINTMLSPRWELATARRGTMPISKEILEAIFSDQDADLFRSLMRDRTKGMNAPFVRPSLKRSKPHQGQDDLFLES